MKAIKANVGGVSSRMTGILDIRAIASALTARVQARSGASIGPRRSTLPVVIENKAVRLIWRAPKAAAYHLMIERKAPPRPRPGKNAALP